MKLLKIILVKKYKNNKTNFSLLQLKTDKEKDIAILGNLIRRVLLKNVNGIKITKVNLFLKHEAKEESKYLPMHKFLTLNSINLPCYELIENFKNLEFNSKNYESLKKKILLINLEKSTKASQIITNQKLRILNRNKQLCTIFSNQIKLKALLEIKICYTLKV
uniref:Plastid-encoded RNA polymerase subunit alpha n=1 Tax=Cryptoglena skujai TaxID=161229 RepID=A0A0G3SK83_9EUGL|nr:RNA polymerase alpha subunit [Cryptoglena skujai]AKL39022.1 RNA polymerase alpha subunit [Cryptoglena skujai]